MMNANLQQAQVVVPAVTPTAGALVGGVVATLASGAIATATGGALPPMLTTPVIAGLFTWLFHFAHQKLGTPE